MRLNDIVHPVFFLALLFIACKQDTGVYDSESKDEQNFQSLEEVYFEDYEPPEHKWGFIDQAGEIAIPAKFDAVGKFSEGLAPANFRGKWGYIDQEGSAVIDFQYKAAHPFHEGFARVQSFDGTYRFIDPAGEVLKSVNFIRAGDFSEGLARVLLANQWGYIDMQGKLAIDPAFDKAWDFENRYALVKQEDLYGVIDRTGAIIVPFQYTRVSGPSGGYFMARKDDKVYYLDRAGNQVFGPFTKGTPFHKGHAFVQSEKGDRQLDAEGNTFPFMAANQPDGIQGLPRYIGEGMWLVKGAGGFAVMDSEGALRTPFRYQQVNRYREGMAAYMRDELWGYLDSTANELTGPVFGLAWDFSDGMARAAFREGIAYIDKSMNPPFYPKFRDMQDFSEGLAAFQER